MRHLVTVILVMLVLGAVVSGCDSTHRYDSRLTAADSLMRSAPDSALAMVEAVVRDSLTDEADRAYRDLLLTQARYRCYITATSDSDINRALNYYRRHDGEREKLTRAYIYKGAVMEELGLPDSAMLYYKTAETTAAPDDYFNLAQINNRIGNLFRTFYGNEQIGFEKYQTALKYYQLIGDKEKQYICLYNMAMFYGILHRSGKNLYIDKAMQTASELHDSLKLYECFELKCRQLLRNDSTIDEAKHLAIICLSQYCDYLNNDVLLDLAAIHAIQERTDSAKHYLSIIDEKNSPGEEQIVKTRKLEILSMIAKVDNESLPHELEMKRSLTSDSILNDKVKYQIERIDKEFNEQKVSRKSEDIRHLQMMVVGLSALLFFVVCSFIFIRFINKRRRVKSYMTALEHAQVNEHTDLVEHLLNDKENAVASFVTGMVDFLKTYAESEQQQSPSMFSQKIKDNIKDAADDTFWNELKYYLDKTHNQIITRIAACPSISESDLRLISLMCCGFSYIEIAIILGYTPKYISNKRRYIAKKMELDIPLQDYLEKEIGKSLKNRHY